MKFWLFLKNKLTIGSFFGLILSLLLTLLIKCANEHVLGFDLLATADLSSNWIYLTTLILFRRIFTLYLEHRLGDTFKISLLDLKGLIRLCRDGSGSLKSHSLEFFTHASNPSSSNHISSSTNTSNTTTYNSNSSNSTSSNPKTSNSTSSYPKTSNSSSSNPNISNPSDGGVSQGKAGLTREDGSSNTLTSIIDKYVNDDESDSKIKDEHLTSTTYGQSKSQLASNTDSVVKTAGIPRDTSNNSLVSNTSSTPSLNTLEKSYSEAVKSGNVKPVQKGKITIKKD